MLFLAGLMGMVLVGATVYVNTGDGLDDVDVDGNEAAIDEYSGQPMVSLGEVIGGTAEDEAISGGDGLDHMNGGAGNDTLDGKAENDLLYGGDDDDTLFGGEENDTLHGDAGDDLLQGDAGDDDLYGHIGDDTIEGGTGDDHVEAGNGDDLIDGGAGDDGLLGYIGADTIVGGAGADTLFGGDGNDLLDGREPIGGLADEDVAGAGANEAGANESGKGVAGEGLAGVLASFESPLGDFLNGGDGDDVIRADAGDIVSGGEGADTLIVGAEFQDWAPDAPPPEMTDFNAAEDALVVLYDDAAPNMIWELSLESDGEDADLTHVLLNGARVMSVHDGGALSLADIQLVPESAAGLLTA